jgi:hypothetical protein|eukprot:COSAG01_NODE_7379_length_3230_cov_2.198978_1_plen_322_part_00
MTDLMVDTRPSHLEARFEVDVRGGRAVEREAQDPRVRTRVIEDVELKRLADTGEVPSAVQSSLKGRRDKGGLLGKAGLRGVESTGMPASMVNFAIATHTAPVVLPVGMLLYGAGSKVQTANDPMASQMGFPHSGLPGPEARQMPDALPATGNLSLYRCTCCRRYISKAEFCVECTYHVGHYKNKGHSHYAWSCCNALDKDHPGCRKKSSHTEDRKFSEIVRSMGCEPSELEMRSQAEKLRARWPAAYADGHLAVEVRVRRGGRQECIELRVLAPPQPSIGAVKTLLHAVRTHAGSAPPAIHACALCATCRRTEAEGGGGAR